MKRGKLLGKTLAFGGLSFIYTCMILIHLNSHELIDFRLIVIENPYNGGRIIINLSLGVRLGLAQKIIVYSIDCG